MSYLFGGNTNLTYEQMLQRRAVAEQLAKQMGRTPRNAGEGLAYIGAAIGSRLAEKRAAKAETRLREEANAAFESLFGGSGGLGSGGVSSRGTGYSTGATGASGADTQADSAYVANVAMDTAAPTAGLPYMLPSEDPDLGDPRRGAMPTGAVRVDDPNVYTTDISGATAGVNPDLLRAIGNSADQAYGPGSSVAVTSGLRQGSAGGSDHNSGEAADFGITDFDGVRSDYSDPRIFDMARVAGGDNVRAVGIGPDYMGGNTFHFGTGQGQGIPTMRTWSDWNTGDNLARFGRNSAGPQGAGDPSFGFRDELQQIADSGSVPFGGGAAGNMVASAPTGGVAGQVRQGLVDRFTAQMGVDPQQAEMLADAFLLNMEDESGLVPDMIERVPNVHGTRGRGLYQLTGSRRDAYEAQYGDDYSIDNQLDFMMSELQGPEARAWEAISGAGNTGEAAAAIVSNFLRPAAQHRDRRVAEYLGGRTPNMETTASAQNPEPVQYADAGGMTDAVEPRARLAQLMTVMNNPMLSEGQRMVAAAMMEQEMAQMFPGPVDPMDELDLQYRQLQIQEMEQQLAGGGDLPSDAALYEYWRGQGLSDEEAFARSQGGPLVDMSGANFGGQQPMSPFQEEMEDLAARRYAGYIEQGDTASAFYGDLQNLARLSDQFQGGASADLTRTLGRLGQAVGMEIDPAIAAQETYESIIARLVPRMRPTGSGPASDFDGLQFLQSLPAAGNTPEGRAMINQTMQALQRHQMDAAEIARRVTRGELTWQQGDQEIAALGNPYQRFQEWQDTAQTPVSAPPDPAAPPPPDAGAGIAPAADFSAMAPQDLLAVDTSAFTPEQWIAYDAALEAALAASMGGN